jgi:hypothetical protein
MRHYYRHAAALAVAYLMLLPPQTSKSPLRFDANAPLNKWGMAGSFGTAAECETYKLKLNSRWLGALEPRHLDTKTISDIRQYQAQELCIGSDDPRLKRN